MQRPRQLRQATALLESAERAVYFAGALALIVAAAGMLVVMTIDVLEGSTGNLTQTIVRVLDRVLLAFILLELAHSIQIILREKALVAEPFLLIGLIAVVRRILILTAEAERLPLRGEAVDNLVIQLAVLTLLVVALAGALYLLYPERRERGGSGAVREDPGGAR